MVETDAVNNQLADIKTILLQAETIYKMKISGNIQHIRGFTKHHI